MPGDDIGGDVWFGTAYAGTIFDYRNPVLGNCAYVAGAHELGHALGLKPAQEAREWRPPRCRPRRTASIHRHDLPVLCRRPDDRLQLEQCGAPQSYMMLDIAALRTMLRAVSPRRLGDAAYSSNPLTGEMSVDGNSRACRAATASPRPLDGGGRDAYDLSTRPAGSNVDLAPGGWSVLAGKPVARLGSTAMARGNVFNAMQYRGDARSLIEDAIGARATEHARGKFPSNRLAGGRPQ